MYPTNHYRNNIRSNTGACQLVKRAGGCGIHILLHILRATRCLTNADGTACWAARSTKALPEMQAKVFSRATDARSPLERRVAAAARPRALFAPRRTRHRAAAAAAESTRQAAGSPSSGRVSTNEPPLKRPRRAQRPGPCLGRATRQRRYCTTAVAGRISSSSPRAPPMAAPAPSSPQLATQGDCVTAAFTHGQAFTVGLGCEPCCPGLVRSALSCRTQRQFGGLARGGIRGAACSSCLPTVSSSSSEQQQGGSTGIGGPAAAQPFQALPHTRN